MAGANFSRIKDWISEVLFYADLNAEFDNIYAHLDPSGVGGYSSNLAQMQLTTDPYPGQTPSLANSLAGEIERLRYQIQQIIGTGVANWYQDPPVSLTQINATALEGGLPNSRLDDGPVSADGMIKALRPQNGANGTAVLDLTTSKLVYYIEGQKYEQLTSVTVTGFSGAPTTNNTALVNNFAFTSQQSTQWAGEHGTFIPVDTVGSEITAVSGKVSGFKVVNGGNTEYFIGQYFVDPTLGPGIYKARRGLFFNYQMVPIPRIALADNNTITLCRLAWLFIGTNGVVTASYNTPTYSQTQPASPDLGDYWYSLTDTVWRTYSPSGWALSGSTLIGMVILDGNNVVGARTTDRFRSFVATNEIQIEVTPTNTLEIRQATYSERISVYGIPFRYGFRNPVWTSAVLEGGGALANNTTYFVYIEDDGNVWLSTICPHDRKGDLAGYYHPSFAWRSVGYASTNGSGQFIPATVFSLSSNREVFLFPTPSVSVITAATYNSLITDRTIFADASLASQVITLLGYTAGQTTRVMRTNSGGNTVSVTASGVTKTMTAQGQSISYEYDGATWQITSFNTNKERISAYASPTIATSNSGNYFDITSLSFAPGDWDTVALGEFDRGGGTFTDFAVGIGTASGNSSAGLVLGDSYMRISGAAEDTIACTVAGYRISIATTTTYYLKGRAVFTTANGTAYGRLTAVRVGF